MWKKIIAVHQKKIIWSAPIIFLVLVSSSGVLGGGNYFLFTAENKSFPIVGEELPITLEIFTKTPVNAVGGTVTFDPKVLTITSLSRITSSVDLWSEEPEYSNTLGTLHFSGGIVGEKADAPIHGQIFVINFKVIAPGKTVIAMEEGELLANNGEGTNVTSGANTLTVYARGVGHTSPDVNGDGILSVADANTLYIKTFRTYDERYDLNGDGKVSWADVRMLIGLF